MFSVYISLNYYNRYVIEHICINHLQNEIQTFDLIYFEILFSVAEGGDSDGNSES